MQDDAKYVQRNVRKCTLDVHPTEKALVVNYEVEAVVVADGDDTVLEQSRECQKTIRLKSLNESTDIVALAREVVSKCDLIPPSRTLEVEQLLTYLQSRKEPRRSSARCTHKADAETASITNTESYVEMLYEDTVDKVRGSALVLQLARNPENLGELCLNDTLLCALARVLREDGRKNLELATNIVYVFFCFSTFSQFHPVITEYKIGSVCMDLIEYELRRHAQWKEDLARKAAEDEGGKEYEKNVKKYQTLVKRQNQLLRIAVYLLLNVAEDPKNEIKMVNRGVVPMLVGTLERDNPDLLLLVVSFLKKLSVYYENTAEMAKLGVVERLAPHLPNGPHLQNAILRLLLNLSFDLELRASMVRAGLLPKLVDMLRGPVAPAVVLCILYHISMDDRCKSHFTYTDCIPIIVRLLLDRSAEKVPLEPAALAVNLAVSKRNAQLMCERGGLTALVKRAFQHRDPLLLKVIRNISQHDGPTKTALLEHVSTIASALNSGADEEFVLECVGTLGNIDVPEANFIDVLREHNLVPWMRGILDSKTSADDLLLEVVVLAGTVANTSGVCALVEGGVVEPLTELLGAKQEDDELVLQIVYAFHGMLRHEGTRRALVRDSKVPGYLLDLLHDQNAEVRRVCSNSLDLVAECNEDWARRIQRAKFRRHNAQWLDMVERCLGNEDEDVDEGVDEPPFADADVLDRSDLLSSGSWASDH